MELAKENDRKKKYLKSYQESVRRVNRINAEIEELRNMRTSISMNNDGMPHGCRQSDLSSYAAELDRMEKKLMEERRRRIRLYKGIEARIKAVKNGYEQDVLFYRYISGLGWWEIAEKMGFSQRHITRIHGKALASFKLPKDVLECPIDM